MTKVTDSDTSRILSVWLWSCIFCLIKLCYKIGGKVILPNISADLPFPSCLFFLSILCFLWHPISFVYCASFPFPFLSIWELNGFRTSFCSRWKICQNAKYSEITKFKNETLQGPSLKRHEKLIEVSTYLWELDD